MGKHTLVSWYVCTAVTIMTLARTAEFHADSCCLAHIIFNLSISINANWDAKGLMQRDNAKTRTF